MRAVTLIMICAIAAISLALGHERLRNPVQTETSRSEKMARLKSAAPDLPRRLMEAKMDESDAIHRVQGDLDIDERMKAVQLTETELREFHARNYEIFQGRSFEESVVSVDILARLQRVRADLSLPPSSRIR
jgi:hypothetical protein